MTKDMLTRIGLVVGTPLAVVLSIEAVVWAATPLKTWSAGETLKAADLNANFTTIASSTVNLAGDQTIAGTKTFTNPLGVGYRIFFQELPGNPGACSRLPNAPQVWDCSCPAGTAVIAGGAIAGTEANDILRESRPVDINRWRFACIHQNGVLVDCPDISYTCARLGTN